MMSTMEDMGDERSLLAHAPPKGWKKVRPRSEALDNDHIDVLGRAGALCARGPVQLGVVEGSCLFVGRKPQHHHAVRFPVAFQGLMLAAAHEKLATASRDRSRR